MKYIYEKEKTDYSDYASGRVLYSLPNAPAFPVRLISEIFQQAYSLFPHKQKVSIYDPCCGCAYHLAALGFLHATKIAKIIASDIDFDILRTAEKNLSLLNSDGLDKRIKELELMVEKYGKVSHTEAVKSALSLKSGIDISHTLFQTDILQHKFVDEFTAQLPDIIFADTPYGKTVDWQGKSDGGDFLYLLLESLKQITNAQTVLIIVTSKDRKFNHPDYFRLKKIKTSDRQIQFFKRIV